MIDKKNREEIEQLIEENEHVFELKDDILELCDGHDLDDIEKALMMVLTDVYMEMCSSREECIERMAIVAAKIMTAINMFDQTGECVWNTKQ